MKASEFKPYLARKCLVVMKNGRRVKGYVTKICSGKEEIIFLQNFDYRSGYHEINLFARKIAFIKVIG